MQTAKCFSSPTHERLDGRDWITEKTNKVNPRHRQEEREQKDVQVSKKALTIHAMRSSPPNSFVIAGKAIVTMTKERTEKNNGSKGTRERPWRTRNNSDKQKEISPPWSSADMNMARSNDKIANRKSQGFSC